MNKIFLTVAAAGVMLGFSSCSETWDDNPVLTTHGNGVVKTANFLNTPALQDQLVEFTAANADNNIQLTCSQPDYGYAAVATYKVQCCLKENFIEDDPKTEDVNECNYVEITQSFYDCANINPVNKDVAGALEKLNGVRSEDDLPLTDQKLYFRLRAYVEQSAEDTQYVSNVVCLNHVSADFLAIWVSDVPVNIYIRGGVDDWSADPDWQFVTGDEENTWILKDKDVPANVSIKVADAAWGPLNLGGNAGENDDSQMVEAGQRYAMTAGDNPGHMRLTEDFHGDIILALEAGIYYITFEPTAE